MNKTPLLVALASFGGAIMGVAFTLSFSAWAENTELDTGTRAIPYNGILEFNGQSFGGQADISFTLTDDNGCTFVENHEDVQVFAGRFSVNLGTVDSVANPIAPCLFDAQAVYLQMSVRDGGSAEPHIALSGRQRINPVPFAYWSAEGSDFKVDGQLTTESAIVTGHLSTNSASITNDLQTGNLTVAGNMSATGNISATDRLVPSVGQGTKGIAWPENAFGGSLDGAWIQYYRDGAGENTALQIGNANDVDDNITFHQAGQVRMNIENGNVSITNDFGVGGNTNLNGTLGSRNITINGLSGQTASLDIRGANTSQANLNASARLNFSLPGHTGYEIAAGAPEGEFDLLFFQRRGGNGPNPIMRLTENGTLLPATGITTTNVVATTLMRMPTGNTPPHACNNNTIGAMYVDTEGQSWGHAVCICVQQDDVAPYWTRADNFSDRNGCGY